MSCRVGRPSMKHFVSILRDLVKNQQEDLRIDYFKAIHTSVRLNSISLLKIEALIL